MTLARYAAVNAAGDVQNIVMWDGETQYDPGDGLTLAIIQDGWGVVDGKLAELAAPVSPPAPPIDLAAYAAAARYAKETGGITINDIQIDTSEESQNRISNAWALIQASGATTISYKAMSGFTTLTVDQFKAVALAVGAHVQACFAVEAAIDAGLSATPPTITTTAQIDAALAAMDSVPAQSTTTAPPVTPTPAPDDPTPAPDPAPSTPPSSST